MLARISDEIHVGRDDGLASDGGEVDAELRGDTPRGAQPGIDLEEVEITP